MNSGGQNRENTVSIDFFKPDFIPDANNRQLYFERNYTKNSTNDTGSIATDFFTGLRRQEDASTIITLVVIIVIIDIFALVGNSLVVLAIGANNKLKRKPSTILTLSLTGSGLINAVFTMPLAILNLTTGVYYPRETRIITCRTMTASILLGSVSALLTVVEHTIDRYLLVMHPLFYRRKITTRLMKLIVGLSWCFSLGLSVTPLWQRNQNIIDSRIIFSCSGIGFNYLLNTLGTFFIYILPITFVIILYSRLYLVIREKSRRMFRVRRELPFAINTPLPISRGVTASERKTIKTIGFVVATLTLMWCPLVAIKIYEVYCYFCLSFADRLPALIISFAVHSVNPFIYAYNEEYQKSYQKVLCFRKRTTAPDFNFNINIYHTGSRMRAS